MLDTEGCGNDVRFIPNAMLIAFDVAGRVPLVESKLTRRFLSSSLCDLDSSLAYRKKTVTRRDEPSSHMERKDNTTRTLLP